MAAESSKPTRGQQKLPNGTVRVWSEVGATLPIPDTYGSIRFSFGHERISPSDVQEEIVKTEALIDEFNEKVLEKRLKKYKRLFDQIFQTEPVKEKTKKTTGGSVQQRAQKKMKKGK